MLIGTVNLVHQLTAEAAFKNTTAEHQSQCHPFGQPLNHETKGNCIEKVTESLDEKSSKAFKKYAESDIFEKSFLTLSSEDIKDEYSNRMNFLALESGDKGMSNEILKRIVDETSAMIDLEYEVKAMFVKHSFVLKNAVYWFILISAVIGCMAITLTLFKRHEPMTFTENLIDNVNNLNDRWFFIMLGALFLVHIHVNSLF